MPQKKWSKQRVIEAIRARHRRGLPMRGVQKDDSKLAVAGRQWFGSWAKAVSAAGVKMPPRGKWAKETVVARIQDWHRQGVPVGRIGQQDLRLRAAGYCRFGSWRAALAAAGLQLTGWKWSKERVIHELQALGRNGVLQGFRRKDHSRLTSAAKKYFGSLHDALNAAGLRQGERKGRRTWTRQQIIDVIRSRHEQGLSLTSVWREDNSFYMIVQRAFGGWRPALRAAGFPMPLKRTWTPESVIQEIRSRRQRGLPLANIQRLDQGLYAAARRHWGGWPEALQAAGIETKRLRRWSRQAVIAALLDWQARGLSFSRVWAEDRGLYDTAVRIFGSWDKTLDFLGVPERPKRKWTRQRVIAELQAWYGRSGEKHRNVTPALSHAAANLFGGLYEAMEAAGVQPKNGRWTDRRVIETIQDRYVQGQPIQFVGFGDPALAGAAQRRFGGWLEAVTAAGLAEKYRQPAPRRTWSKEATIEAILARRRQGLPLMRISKKDSGLYYAANKYFGSWPAALHAAGIAPEEASNISRPIIQTS